MAEGAGGQAEGPDGDRHRRAIANLFRLMRRQHSALEDAVGEFRDADGFVESWGSEDPKELNKVNAMERAYENIINAAQELTDECERELRRRGEEESPGEDGPGRWGRLESRGLISAEQAGKWRELAEPRRRLQHGYAHLEQRRPRAHYDHANDLLAETPRMVSALKKWVAEIWPGTSDC